MNNLQDQAISTAKQIKEQSGGIIFAFPIEESNPFSSYAIVMCVEDQYFAYPGATDISMAAAGILTLLEEMKKSGMDADYKRNVRLISYQTQMDAPSTVMRQLKKEMKEIVSKPLFEPGKDFNKNGEEPENVSFSARGVLKMSFLEMVDEKNPKAIQFMERYYQLLATRKYGKTAAAIKQEVRKLGKEQGINWLEQTFSKYVHDDSEIIAIFTSLSGGI